MLQILESLGFWKLNSPRKYVEDCSLQIKSACFLDFFKTEGFNFFEAAGRGLRYLSGINFLKDGIGEISVRSIIEYVRQVKSFEFPTREYCYADLDQELVNNQFK